MHCRHYSNLSMLTRRQWLSRLGHGVGTAALAALMNPETRAAGGIPGLPHFAPKAKRVICLFMSGGLSQLESFDYKPLLISRAQEPLPASVFKGRQPLGMSRLQANFPINDDAYGREHHRDAFTCWMAGAGVKPGFTHGVTDDFGFDVIEGRVTVNDFHATLLHLLGIDHERFTYRYQGRDFRLTDVAGEIVTPILS